MKILLLAILAFSLNACVPDISGDVDNSIDNSVNYGEGTVLNCPEGSNCTVSADQSDPSDGDAVIGVYDPEYTQAECNAAGFFFCTIEQACLNTPLDGGSCSTHTD